MTKFVFSTATTFNGYIADHDHSLQWLFDVEPTDVGVENRLEASGALVMGRSTYDWLLAHEAVLDDPEKWLGFYGRTPVFLFTSRPFDQPEGADVRVISGAVADALPAIRGAAGDRDVWVIGGGDLAGQFFDAGALDEIELHMTPVALDGGAPLFPRRVESDRVRLVEARRAGQFAVLRYAISSEARHQHDASPESERHSAT